MSALIGARAARMRRACERWLEANDGAGISLAALAEAATAHATGLGRDLTPGEVSAGCEALAAAHAHEEEQRKAREALAGAREEERLAYLRRRQQTLILTRSDPPPPRKT